MEPLRLSVKESTSRLSFGYRHAAGVGVPSSFSDRYLAVDAREVIDVGFPCPSCTFLFSRTNSIERDRFLNEVSPRLASGVSALDWALIETIEPTLPPGEYIAVLTRLRPQLVARGDDDDYFSKVYLPATDRDHDPETAYYRGRSGVLSNHGNSGTRSPFYELAVPLLPFEHHNAQTVASWRARLAAGARPAAVSIALMQWVERNPDPHVVLTHFLIDGHHKTLAAARDNRDIDVAMFLNLEIDPTRSWAEESVRALLGQITG